jgi:hypothetical protein
MIGIRNIYVETYDFNSLTVNWEYEVQQPGIVLSTTTVDIQRSESDNFSTISTVAAGLSANNTTSYTDATLSGILTNRYKDINYRLRFVESNGALTLSKIVWLDGDVSLPAKEIIRRKNVIRIKENNTIFSVIFLSN